MTWEKGAFGRYTDRGIPPVPSHFWRRSEKTFFPGIPFLTDRSTCLGKEETMKLIWKR